MKNFFTFLIITLFVITKSSAQDPFYYNSTIENNLPSNEVYSIFKDQRGYIWIGCDAGLYRYNGTKYQYFTCDEQRSKSITGICETQNGTLYCYNFNGQIFQLKNGKLSVVKNWNLSISNITTSGNKLFITNVEGLSILDENGKINTISVFNNKGLKEQSLQTTCGRTTKDQSVYFLQNSGVLQLKYNQKIPNVYPVETKDNLGEYYLSRSSKNPWLIGVISGKLFRLEDNKYKQFQYQPLENLISNRKITNIIEGKDHRLWILTYSGVIYFNPKTKYVQLFYPSISFSDFLVDNEGNHWFSTLHNGIIRIPNMKYIVWNSESNTLQNDQITHLTKTEKEIYFTTSDGKIGKINPTQKNISILNFNLKADIGFLYFDSIDKCVYFNVSNTIYKIQDSKITPIKNDFPPIKKMEHTTSGYFFATSRGLFHYQNLSEPFSKKTPLSPEWARGIYFNNDDLYIGDNYGITLFDKKETTYKHFKNLLAEKLIVSIDHGFALAFDGKIYEIKGDKIKRITTLNSTIRVYQLRYQNQQIYVTSNQGLFQFNLTNHSWKQLLKLDGLASNNIKEIELSEEGIWLATDNGLQLIPMNAFNQKHYRSTIDVEKIKINQRALQSNEKVIIYPNQLLAVDLNALAYRSNGEVQYAYRFGVDGEWFKIPGSIQELKFPNLPAGEYSIQIKLIDHLGIDSKNQINIPIKVYPPFWLRSWFIIICALLFISIVIFVYKYRIQLLRKKQIKEIKQLRLENELRLTQQNALKAQMNPHFLFNVLNSIKGFIYENDKKNAAKYLSDFSNLVRKVLDMSSIPSVSLDEEMEMVEIYIQLEQMLLHSDFEYTIDIDDSIDTNYIKIPTLIIQPYIENAFKHGLRHKAGLKKLAISITCIQGVLTISIIDNGIGRIAAENINREIERTHTSFATNALEKRLELLNHSAKDFVGVEIIDNFNENSEATGTTVIIRIHV